MKRLAIVVIVVGAILGGITLYKPQVIEYKQPEVKVETKEVQVDALEKAIRDAQEAKESDIKATAQKAYDEAYTQEMKKVELQVISEFNKKLKLREEELQNEVSL